jgi:uncharacterized membrane protein
MVKSAASHTEASGRKSPHAAAPAAGGSLAVKTVSLDRPWAWLTSGWQDMRAAAHVSITYGLVFVIVGFLLAALLYALDLFYFVLPLAAGFMLVAPILAVGLYEVSRRLAEGKTVTMATPLEAWQRNMNQIALMGLVLMLFLLAWIRLATLIFALFFAKTPPHIGEFIETVFFSWTSAPFLVVGVGIGAVLAALVFAISAISVPMLLDRDTNIFSAIGTSVQVVLKNPGPMLVWAVLIVVFTAAGLATLFVGLAITLPLIGHSTWHAYRDLIGAPPSRAKSGAD